MLGGKILAEEDLSANPLFISLFSAPGIPSATDFICQSNQKLVMVGTYVLQGAFAFAPLKVTQFFR